MFWTIMKNVEKEDDEFDRCLIYRLFKAERLETFVHTLNH